MIESSFPRLSLLPVINATLHDYLISIGFHRIHADHSVFVFKRGRLTVILPVYVDDKLLAGNDNALLDSIQKAISSHFKTSNLGTATWILGIQVTHDIAAGTLSINQSQYLKGVLSHFGMSDCTSVSIPLPAGKYYEPASLDEHTAMASSLFLKVIGSLTYAAMGMRPNISAAMRSLSLFAASFGRIHIDAVKHILRYLRGMLDRGILYTMGGGELVGYTDVDWANDTTNRCSISGFAFLYAGGGVSWMSKQQSTVAMSSTHAEYISAAGAAKELVWLHRLLSEVGEGVSGPMTLYIDNHAADLLVRNPVNHSATKHIDVHYHFIPPCTHQAQSFLPHAQDGIPELKLGCEHQAEGGCNNCSSRCLSRSWHPG